MMNPSTSSSSSSTSSTSITSLPLEILLKILAGLPPKSAVRFRCTSKFFYSFIPEPRFAFRILVSLPSRTPPQLNLYSVSYREEIHGNLRADTAQLLDVRGLLSSADGKMCLLSNASGDDAVFDLSTGRRICLPRIGGPAGGAVLGFDSVSERYKVFNSELYYDSDRRRVMNRLWVLTVGVDKSWREIDSTTVTAAFELGAVHIHGIIYWIPLINESLAGCWTRPFKNLFISLSSELKIVAIDVSTESFITSIPFPSECQSPQHQPGWLPWIKLNNRLAFINILDSQTTKSLTSEAPTLLPDKIDIWALEMSMEWEKQTVVLPLEEREVIGETSFMGFSGNSMGEIMFLVEKKRIMSPLVLVYSFGREVWKRFEINGVGNYSLSFLYIMRGVVYVEDEIVTFLE